MLDINANIWGFAVVKDPSKLKMKDIERELRFRGAHLEDVVFSMWDNTKGGCVWIVASDKELTEKEVQEVIRYFIENELSDFYDLR